MAKKLWAVRYRPPKTVVTYTDADSPHTRAKALMIAMDLALHNPKWHIYVNRMTDGGYTPHLCIYDHKPTEGTT